MKRVNGLLLDVEGTLVGDKRYQAIPGAVGFVRHARASGVPLRLITNNTTDPRPDLIEKLRRAGFDLRTEELHTCIDAAITHLGSSEADTLLVIGGEPLRQMFTEAGFHVLNSSEVDAVVIGLDTDLTFKRMQMACDAVGRCGAALLALHRNRLFTDAEGRIGPSVGAIVEAIAYATRVDPLLIGKPSPAYYAQALDELGVPVERVLVVSDDPFSDLAGAKRMGMAAALVLSGKYRDRAVIDAVAPPERPDVVIERIGDLIGHEEIAIG